MKLREAETLLLPVLHDDFHATLVFAMIGVRKKKKKQDEEAR